jgi:hypothetical protein
LHAPKLARRGLLILGGLIVLAFAGTAQADDLPGAFHGNAYATFANVKAGPIAATLWRSASLACTCEGTDGKTKTNEVDGLSAGDNGNSLIANKTMTTVFTSKTATTADVQNTSSIGGFNALAGLITADGIKAVASISATKNTITPSSDGSSFTNLVIAGQAVPANVPVNTTIPLPGIGSVTLNAVTNSGKFKNGGSVLVEMMRINVGIKNNLGLAVGSKIVVAHASAGYERKQPVDVYDGSAYAAYASDAIGSQLANKIGKPAAIALGCEGSKGKTKTNSVASIPINGAFSAGGGETTAFGGKEGGADVARTTSTLSSIKLLGGLIAVDGLQAVAQSSVQNGVVTPSTDGSGFAGLTVLGLPVPVTVPANTALPLPGIGTLTVNEQIVKKNGDVTVNGLHLVVLTANLFGLPVGSELVLAHAHASASPF